MFAMRACLPAPTGPPRTLSPSCCLARPSTRRGPCQPFFGFLISRYWGLAKGLAVGVALVSCMPGGTASNIVAYIAKVRRATHACMHAPRPRRRRSNSACA